MQAQAEVQVGAQARGEQPVRQLLHIHPLAGAGGAQVILGLDRIEHRLQRNLASPRLHQALVQHAGFVRFEQVAVERGFGRLRHLGIGGFAGDDDEHRRVRQQLRAAQIVQQILAGAFAVAVKALLAQHKVSALGFEEFARVAHATKVRHVADAEIAQLADHDAARGLVTVDDQGPAAGQIPLRQLGRDTAHPAAPF